MLSDGYTDRLLVYESRRRRLARVREKIKPLNKTYPSINLRGLITIYSVVRRATATPPCIRSESRLSYRSSICTESHESSRKANISLPVPSSIEIKPTFTAVPFVRGRKFVQAGDPLFVSVVPVQWARGRTAQYLAVSTEGDGCTFIQRYVSKLCVCVCVSILPFSPSVSHSRAGHTPWRTYFGQQVPVWAPLFYAASIKLPRYLSKIIATFIDRNANEVTSRSTLALLRLTSDLLRFV